MPKRQTVELTEQDIAIFKATQRTGNLDIFTSHYFRLPYSGTRFSPTERPDEYDMLHDAWVRLGRPEPEFRARLDDKMVTIKVLWEGGSEPVLLYHHGYLFLPWVKEMWQSGKRIIVVEGGTGSGKTSGVGLFALTMCALTPAYEFLNVAPTATQAEDMLAEVEKWIIGAEFERFVVRTRTGELYRKRPYPEFIINTGGPYDSIFGCMTMGQHGNWVLGKGKDWISVDEAGLLPDIDTMIPRLVTRLRGTRRDGRPRDGRMSFISNPHRTPGWRRLVKKAMQLAEEPDSQYFFARPSVRENPAVSQAQLELQMELLDSADVARWHEGDATSVENTGEFPSVLVECCHDESLETLMESLVLDNDPRIEYLTRREVGVIHWQLPSPAGGGAFVTIGDPGQANKCRLRDNNVPVVMVFEVTNFPKGPATLRAFHMLDGNGRYKPWKECMMRMITQFPGLACYDATATQIAFSEDMFFAGVKLWPISLGGGVKPLAKTLLKMFMEDGLIALPYIPALWYEFSVYRESGPGVRKLPDDGLSCLFLLAYVLRQIYATSLGAKYGQQGEDRAEQELDDLLVGGAGESGRYERPYRRYGGRGL